MLQYLIRVTDNTLPAAIVFSLLALLVAQTTRKGERGFMLYGLALGGVAALGYAVLKRNTGIAVREYYDLGVILPSLAVCLVMLFAMWPLFGPDKEAGPAGKTLMALIAAALAAYALPNILLYPLDFGVGMDSIFNTDFLYKVIGYCLGLLLMFVLGLGIRKVAGGLSRRQLLLLFFLALAVFFAKQLLEAVQIGVARNLFPRRRWLTSLVIFVLAHANWFSFALMGLVTVFGAGVVLRAWFEPVRGSNPAVRRKQRAVRRSVCRYGASIFFCLVLFSLTLTGLRAYANREVEISAPIEMKAEGGKILHPLETVSDGNLHRFQYRTPDGTMVLYIIIKKSESAYGVGLDACDICGPSGYYQRKGQVVCKLCDVVMNISTIGFPGGCNPVPLRFSISRGNLVILASDLVDEEQRFQ